MEIATFCHAHEFKNAPFQGPQTKIAPRASEDLQSKPMAGLWRWRNNGGTRTLLETAFTCYFLRKVSWVIGKSFLAVFTFVWKVLVHSLAEHLHKLNNLVLIISKFPKSIASRAKCPREPHAGRVFETPGSGRNTPAIIVMLHVTFFALVPQMAIWFESCLQTGSEKMHQKRSGWSREVQIGVCGDSCH